MKIPSPREFDEYVAKHYNWRAMDQALYCLCAMQPKGRITRFDLMSSSVQTIGRTYQALFNAPERIVECLADRAIGPRAQWTFRWISSQIQRLPRGPEITKEGVATSMVVHGRVCQRIHGGGVGKILRSLVSNWLHFHRPGVPILDSYASNALACMETQGHLKLAKLEPQGDDSIDGDYRRLCERLWLFAQKLEGSLPSVRDLDVYLYLHGKKKA